MAHVTKYNAQGEKVGTIEVSDAVFDISPKAALIHQVYTAERANARRPWADTKKRGEVRGGGRKPWQQKGTGRARHGSIRSPIWKGGGVTFGPLSLRNYTQKVNKKMSRQALRMCLSDKVKHGLLAVVESFDASGKTKPAVALIRTLSLPGRSALVLLPKDTPAVQRAFQNVPHIAVRRPDDITVEDVLTHAAVIATEESVKALEKRFI